MSVSFSEPGTRLEISWPSFDAYLQHLSKSMQKDYRRHRNRSADLGISVAVDQTPPPAADALRLIRNVEHHHGAPVHPLTSILSHTPEMTGSWWLKATIGDRLVGCGAYDIKQRLGFVLESNHFTRYAVQGRWMHWLARRLA